MNPTKTPFECVWNKVNRIEVTCSFHSPPFDFSGMDRIFANDGGTDTIFADLVDLLDNLDPKDRVHRRRRH